jgi:hypothetical protein
VNGKTDLNFDRRACGAYTDNQIKYIRIGWNMLARQLAEAKQPTTADQPAPASND